MNNKTPVLTAFILAFAASAWASSQEKVNREFDAHPGGKLVVDVDFGSVNVNAGSDDKVSIKARRDIDFGDEAAEKEFLAAAPLTISADGNTVTVRARSDNESRQHHFHHATMNAHYEIRVPKNFSAQLNTGGGQISATGLIGDIRLDSGGGSIQIESCRGPVEAKTGGGQIVLRQGEGSCRARTGGGSIAVRDFDGDADVSTGGGELVLEKIRGSIKGDTGGGSITASATSTPLKNITLESSGGSISLSLPANAAAEINAETSAGRISTDLPLSTSKADDEHLRGTLNGGGSPVLLRTSGGSISINSASGETAAR